MKKLTGLKQGEINKLFESREEFPGSYSMENFSQNFVSLLYENFRESILLVRIFIIIPRGALPGSLKSFVDKKCADTGTLNLLNDRTPVFTLLGTRGNHPQWNHRSMSNHFRCIPLVSSAYVSSLTMLSRYFHCIGIGSETFNKWDSIEKSGRMDHFGGAMLIGDAGLDRDEKGRMIVPRQEFVKENSVVSVIGLGRGYDNLPSMSTLFVFTRDHLDNEILKDFAPSMDEFISSTREMAARGLFFENDYGKE